MKVDRTYHGRISETLETVPDSATDNTHGKGTTEITQDNNGAGVSTVIRSHFVFVLDAENAVEKRKGKKKKERSGVEGTKGRCQSLDGDVMAEGGWEVSNFQSELTSQ